MTLAFDVAAQPGIAGARERSAPVNAAWLAGPAREIAARFAAGADADAVEAQATALLADTAWVREILTPLVRALREDPWFEPPFKASRDPLRIGMVLVDCPTVTISATVTRADGLNRLPLPLTVVIPGRVTITRYARGGDARMRRWRTEPIGPGFSAATADRCREIAPLTLADGMLFRQDGRIEGHLIVAAESDLVALTATIKPGASPLMREYAVADGAFARAGSADDLASRAEMLLTFLRVSGRRDASGVFEAATWDPAFHLRWAAMREWLMLDAAAARPRLERMAAADPNAEVRAAAAATLPALDRRLARPCRA